MVKPKTEPSKGILKPEEAAKQFSHKNYWPSDEVAHFVEHYWIVRWNLTGKAPYRQEVLTHPSVHLVFERNNTWIWGIQTGKFTRELSNKGHVLGIKFHPGGFFPFFQQPVISFTNKLLAFNKVFPDDIHSLEREILGFTDDMAMVHRAESFLRAHLPNKDIRVEQISQMMEAIRTDKSILKVEDLAALFPYSKRTIQRLFRQYTGVTPKWAIKRYRLHEAAEKMATDSTEKWTAIAIDLGYYDQAHFIRDFKNIVGLSPVEYVQSLSNK